MTITTSAVPDTDHTTTDAGAGADPEAVIRLRPEQVGQHPENIRDASRDIPALAASIREVGVLVPLIVVPVSTVPGDWPETVTHVAVDGNRRVAAATQTDAMLPCIVRDSNGGKDSAAVTMAVTGLARDGLTGPEQVTAVQTMLDLGLSQAAIGRATGMKPRTVKAAKTAATLTGDVAAQAHAHDLTLDQLAILAEHQVKWTNFRSRAEIAAVDWGSVQQGHTVSRSGIGVIG